MEQELNNSNPKKVIQRLQLRDILLIVLPMVAATAVMVIAAINAPDSSIIPREALILMEIAAGVVFCVFYGVLALILSRVTTRNNFRLSLIGVLAGMVMFFAPSIFSNFAAFVR